jgi:DNA invertase Pin-like site-specific DNA recombinase
MTMRDSVIYARVSIDRTGQSLAVERQEKECRALAERLGLNVTDVYIDNDISATKGRTRAGFEALLKAKPAAIVTWHQDRLLRLGKDLERVIDLNVPVYTVSAGTLDLTTPPGRAVARTVAAWSQYEGEQKAVRQLSKNTQLVDSGMPVPGRRRYGFEPGNVLAMPEEAEQVRRLFADFLDGVSIRSLAQRMGWRNLRVRDTLMNPGYAGWVVRNGDRFEAHESVARIIDRDTFERVQAVLTAPGRRTTPGSTIRHLASGIARCGVCDRPMVYRNSYLCLHDLGHPTIKKEFLETKIRDEVGNALTFGTIDLPESDRLHGIDARMVELDDAEANFSAALAGGMKWSAIEPQMKALNAERAELEDERTTLLAQSVQATMLASLQREVYDLTSRRVSIDKAAELRAILRDRYDALDIDRKRELVRGLLDIRVMPGRGPERVEVTPR